MKNISKILEGLYQQRIHEGELFRSEELMEQQKDYLEDNLKGFKYKNYSGSFEGKYWRYSLDAARITLIANDPEWEEFYIDKDKAIDKVLSLYNNHKNFTQEAEKELKSLIDVLKKMEKSGIPIS